MSKKMGSKLVSALTTAVALQIIAASKLICPGDPNCVCEGTIAVELSCNIGGQNIRIDLLPNTYINIKCEGAASLDYKKLPKCANDKSFKSVSFKDCPLPPTSFSDVLADLGVSKTTALIFQNPKNLSGYFDRKQFAGLQDLTKLLLSINGVTHLPDNLFVDINKLTWLNIRSNGINLSEELFKPLEKLETLEISHNHMANISSNLFSHLSFLRKLSLWQSNVTWFSKDFFSGVDVLEELDLSSNGLNELPASIFKPLRKLKKLTLFSNKFSSLPVNLFSSNDELETVVILNNDVKLKELPKHLFGSLRNLKQVYIQRSGLEKLPYELFANSSSLTNISLAYNDLQVLPEAIFNDQINLLELDLSYNKLKKLEDKIFSSLVRLETLNLCHNSLEEISGSTFSSLLSLIYLNMENNKLKTIPSYVFSNNKQKMYISLAFNKLNFEHKRLENNSWIVTKASPFAHTFNLRLLNLSHNRFRNTFEDWWFNGHESLDISYNLINNLWPIETNSSKLTFHENVYRGPTKKFLKMLWFAHNPLSCDCKNMKFVEFLNEKSKTRLVEQQEPRCSVWGRLSCYNAYEAYITTALIVSFVVLKIISLGLCIIYRRRIYLYIKDKMYILSQIESYRKPQVSADAIIIKYAEIDEEFVFKEIIPGLKGTRNFKIQTCPMNNNKQSIIKNFKICLKDVCTTLVVFSPNYLTSVYSDVSIKKIRGEMLKAKGVVYIFVDIGPDNSIYAFLKEQRNRSETLLWNQPDFWNAFLELLPADDECKSVRLINHGINSLNGNDKTNTSRNGTTQVDHANFYALNALAHSQV